MIKVTAPNKGVEKAKKPHKQMRCRSCPGMAVSVPDGKGSNILQCQNCKRTYTYTVI